MPVIAGGGPSARAADTTPITAARAVTARGANVAVVCMSARRLRLSLNGMRLRFFPFALALAAAPAVADEPAPPGSYVPPPAASVRDYFAEPLACKVDHGDEEHPVPHVLVVCKDHLLEKKTLRELAI